MTKKMGVLFLKRGLKVYEDLFSLLKIKSSTTESIYNFSWFMVL